MFPQGNETIDLAVHAHPSQPQEAKPLVSWINREAVVFVLGPEHIYMMVPKDKELLVGRQHTTGGPQPDLDLSAYGATEAGTSRLHVALKYEQSGWSLTDMNSSNGTWVDGERLAPFVPFKLSKINHVFLSNLEMLIVLPEGSNSRLIL